MAFMKEWYYQRMTWHEWYTSALVGAMYCALPASVAYLALDWINFFDTRFFGGPHFGTTTRGAFWCIAGAFGGVWAYHRHTFGTHRDGHDAVPDEDITEDKLRR